MRQLFPFFSARAWLPGALAACLTWAIPAGVLAQQQARQVTVEQNASLPFRLSGRLSVKHGSDGFFGTATMIRRYTALTAGHLLYQGGTGFSTNVFYQPDYFINVVTRSTPAAAINVLSGYQDAANLDGDSDDSFTRDLGYVLFASPALNDEFADFAPMPEGLMLAGINKLVAGYAAESLSGDVMAFVNTTAPFVLLRDGLYESTDYYTQEGMSGGPLFELVGNNWLVLAETVAGTSPPARALSDVRAITDAENTLLINAEYANGQVTGAFLTGPATVGAGKKAAFHTGVIFRDGQREGRELPARYAELKIWPVGPYKNLVSPKFVKPGKFKLTFDSSIPSGTKIELRLVRNTLPNRKQPVLQKLTVTVN